MRPPSPLPLESRRRLWAEVWQQLLQPLPDEDAPDERAEQARTACPGPDDDRPRLAATNPSAAEPSGESAD